MYKEIIQKILNILEADKAALKIETFFFGEPLRWEKFPHIWVDLYNDVQEPRTAMENLHKMQFQIIVMDRGNTAEEADKSALEKAERIEVDLNANPTLSGLVRDGWTSLAEKRAGAVAAFPVASCRIMFYCEKGVAV